uniref:C2H2-type domain-containing protein n=1 Tax=Astatotilapia calliptera TaxID=8154 RepID=A0AAX7TYY1_ASTCA
CLRCFLITYGEEKPNSSELYCHQTSKQIKTETDGDDCGGPESARNLDTKSTLQPNEVENDSDSSETELSNDGDEWQGPLSDFRPGTEDSDKDWEASRSPESGVNCHVRCDTTKKPFSCSECGKCFLHRQSLHRHMRIHTGEKPFCCAVCGEKFSRKTHFKTHMRVHTGEKPFDCGFCGKRFSQKSNFKEHLRVHTGETPFGLFLICSLLFMCKICCSVASRPVCLCLVICCKHCPLYVKVLVARLG